MPRTTRDVVPAGRLAGMAQPVLPLPSARSARPWTLADTATVLAAFADPDIRRWHLREVRDDDEAARWIEQSNAEWRDERGASWLVVDAEDRPLGRVGLRGVNLAMGTAQVSYWVLPQHRGRGVATTALRGLATWSLDGLGLHRLWLMHAVVNTASCRVAEGAGFGAEGTWRDGLLHADGWHDMHLHGRLAGDVLPPP